MRDSTSTFARLLSALGGRSPGPKGVLLGWAQAVNPLLPHAKARTKSSHSGKLR